MSYELRTPLTSILGFSEMLTGGYAGDLNGQQGEYMRAILESADRLQGLIDNILDLAISDAGALELDIQRPEERRVGKEWCSRWRARGSQYHSKTKAEDTQKLK